MPERPLGVVYVITLTAVGGAERQVLELASTFGKRGWGVGVVSMLPIHEQFLPVEEAGVRLASLEMTKGVADLRSFRAELETVIAEYRLAENVSSACEGLSS